VIPEEMLREAAARSFENYVFALLSDYDPEYRWAFSPAFEKRIRRLRRRADHPVIYRTLKRVAVFLLALLAAGAVWIAADKEARAAFFDWFDDAFLFGQMIRRTLSDPENSAVIGTVYGKEITRSQLEYVKYRMGNENLSDGKALEQLAKEMILMDLAAEAGIAYSEADVVQMIREEEAYIQAEVERGNPNMLRRVEEDERFLQGLGIRREEFLEGLYFDFVQYDATYREYVKYYYENLYQEYGMPFADYIDSMYDLRAGKVQ